MDGAGVGLSDACILTPLIVIVTIPMLHLFFYFFQSEESAKAAAMELYSLNIRKAVDEFKDQEADDKDREQSVTGKDLDQFFKLKVKKPAANERQPSPSDLVRQFSSDLKYQVQPFEDI